ncbi:MAG: UDP-N-acetylglucosamine 1-carboxyvinyltransferase [Thermoanaerobaculia bacterium]|nr:UDP-N-acetylglucosamine 1-carboxyvinyltransferase [Thermoanaerobaculia bacterium]
MDKLRIHGPCRLSGTLRASGAKNASLPALAACLLTGDEVVLRHVPRVRDIVTMSKLLGHLGVERDEDPSGADGEPGALRLRANGHGSAPDEAPYDLVKTMRAGVLTLGPLLARRGHAKVSLPGGCAIGVRPVDQHLAGLEAMGAEVDIDHGYIHASSTHLPDRRLQGARFRFATRTVTGTENLLMAAVLARGTSVLENCAQEPEVGDLATLLRSMGAHIDDDGHGTLTVEGRRSLHGAEHRVIPDRIEAGTYLVGAVMTRGDVTVVGTRPADLAPLLEKLAEIGAEITTEDGKHNGSIRVRHDGDIGARDLVTAPHPGFPTDLQAQYMALMTQASGAATISETVFENRFQHVPELGRMGADIRIVRANYAQVHGPSRLSGATVMATDLRASACLVLAGLAADGETVIDRIYHLDRGYEKMESKLQRLGVRVERLSS